MKNSKLIFNKDSVKCGKFIKDIKLTKMDIQYQRYPILQNIYKCIEETGKKTNYEIIKTIKFKISETPLIFGFFNFLFETGQLEPFLEDIKSSDANIIITAIKQNNINPILTWYQKNKKKLCRYSIWNDYLSEQIEDETFLQLVYGNIFFSPKYENLLLGKVIKKISINKNNFNINILLINNKKPNINNLIHICTFMQKLSTKPGQKININILYSDFKKEFDFDSNNKLLNESNINSGSTIPGYYINLWRSEEIDKVLIHELIHYLYFDFKSYLTDYELFTNLISQLNVKGEIKLNEAFTETLALIIHSVFLSYKIFMSIDFLNPILNYEINFSVFQCFKILSFFDIGLENIFINNAETINQTTDVFSYFIVKTFFLLSITDFLLFINDNLNFSERYNEFINLIEISLSKKGYFIKLLSEFNKIKKDKTQFIWKTLRMTCLQLN